MANEEHLEILIPSVYMEGAEEWNNWRAEHPNIIPDLSGVNLRSTDLSNADLSNTDLSGADFSHADLSGSNLSNAYLAYTTLCGAVLSGANLKSANLSGANLNGASLWFVNLAKAKLKETKFQQARMWALFVANPVGRSMSISSAESASIFGKYSKPHLPNFNN